MLTELESRCLKTLRDYISQHGHAPTLSELGARVGISSRGTMHRYVSNLVDKGYLERATKPGWRGIALTEQAAQQLNTLPLLGRIAAGRPIEAIPNQSSINLLEMFRGPNRYVLQVEGDSMIDAGILNGDLVVIESQDHASDGEIVVALVDDEQVTLKRLKHAGQAEIELIPENRTLAPMRYDASRVKIQGVLVGQIRSYSRK